MGFLGHTSKHYKWVISLWKLNSTSYNSKYAKTSLYTILVTQSCVSISRVSIVRAYLFNFGYWHTSHADCLETGIEVFSRELIALIFELTQSQKSLGSVEWASNFTDMAKKGYWKNKYKTHHLLDVTSKINLYANVILNFS